MLKKYSNKKLNLRKETQKKKNTKRSFKKKKLKIRQKIQKSKKKTTKIGGFDLKQTGITDSEIRDRMPLKERDNIQTDFDLSSDEDEENMEKQILETDGDSLEDCKNYLDTEGTDKKCFDEDQIKQCLYRKKKKFIRDMFSIMDTLKEKEGYNKECKVKVRNLSKTALDLIHSEDCIPFKEIMNLLSLYKKKENKENNDKHWLEKNIYLIINSLQRQDFTLDCQQETRELWNKIKELFVTE